MKLKIKSIYYILFTPFLLCFLGFFYFKTSRELRSFEDLEGEDQIQDENIHLFSEEEESEDEEISEYEQQEYEYYEENEKLNQRVVLYVGGGLIFLAIYTLKSNQNNITISSPQNNITLNSSSNSTTYIEPASEDYNVDDKKLLKYLEGKFKAQKGRNKDSEFVGICDMKKALRGTKHSTKDIDGNLKKLESFAKERKWTTFRGKHFDWWMFPIPKYASGMGNKFVVYEEDIKSLGLDEIYMKDYKKGIELTAQSWGWDINNGKRFDNPSKEMIWSKYLVRMGKMVESLLAFYYVLADKYPFLANYYLSLRKFYLILKKEGNLYPKDYGKDNPYWKNYFDSTFASPLPDELKNNN